MKVFRIEHPRERKGPYQCNHNNRTKMIRDKLGDSHDEDYDGHPVIGNCVPGWLYGFTSVPKMLKWFDGFFDLLRWGGYRIFVYQIDESEMESEPEQCCFNPNFAEVKKVLKIPKNLENIGNLIYSNSLLIMKTTAA